MKRDLYGFLKEFREPDGYINNLYKQKELILVPDKSGAYIFLSKKQRFIYPDGESKVIYIGMSNNLNRRIKKHYSILSELKDLTKNEILKDWHYTRYQYMNKFGCQVFWYTTRGTQESKSLERALIEFFYDKYLSLPIGNGAFSY